SHDSNRWRQQRIQRPLKLLRRKRRLRPEARHLPQCVHTRIRPPRSMQLHILLRQPPQHGHQFALHCRFICLDLPTVEIRPVVRNRQLDISHRLPRPGHFGVRRLAAAFAISPPPTNDLSSPTAPLPRLLRHPNLPRAIPSLLPASVAQSLLTVLLGSSSPRPPNLLRAFPNLLRAFPNLLRAFPNLVIPSPPRRARDLLSPSSLRPRCLRVYPEPRRVLHPSRFSAKGGLFRSNASFPLLFSAPFPTFSAPFPTLSSRATRGICFPPLLCVLSALSVSLFLLPDRCYLIAD